MKLVASILCGAVLWAGVALPARAGPLPAPGGLPAADYLADLRSRLSDGRISCRDGVRELDRFLQQLEAGGGHYAAYLALRMAQNRLDFRERDKAVSLIAATAQALERERSVGLAMAVPSSQR